MSYDTLVRDGVEYTLVPTEDLEDMLDIAAAREVKDRIESGEEELLPSEMVARLVEGENPIRVWREHRGLTQRALAAACDVHHVNLSQIESGRREPAVSTLKRIAEALNVDLDDLA